MSFRVLDPDGVWRFFGDGALKHLLNVLIQKKLRSEQACEEARERILGHPFLCFDRHECAEGAYRVKRAKRCREMIGELKVQLDRRPVRYLGLEGIAGDPRLTIDRLTGHSVRLLDLTDNHLLIYIERHPFGGSGLVLVQHWLYSRDTVELRLLEHKERAQQAIQGEAKRCVGGVWQKPDGEAQEDFLSVVERYLGSKAREDVEKNFKPNETGLLELMPPEIATQCKAVTGIDHEAEESRQQQIREAGYIKKFGPREQRGAAGVGLILDGGIRLIMADEKKKHD